ncbi:AraD1 family protein [Labrys okinawensis]|uniref:AraD1 family protein n=1 Tax=Labrys okinawensis TaxID=346911 RepID=UPI0039BD4E40
MANSSLRLAQIQLDGQRAVAATEGGASRLVRNTASVLELAQAAIEAGRSLKAEIETRGLGEGVDLAALLKAGRVLAPIDHPDPNHVMVAGTGLTHLGSAEGRDKMHKDLADLSKATDSMKMFRMGLDGGRPEHGTAGVQPEWFYKGDGSTLVPPQGAFPSPSFALDAGEEPELAGIYVNGPDGTPWRIGFALGNEFSDHVTERQNYLYLAHSKLRVSSIGPELLVGEPPADIRGTSRILRDGKVIWEKPFLTGEANMSHTLANLEGHHFKYRLFRQPGDVNVHYFGTATLSVSDGVQTQEGDVFEISAEPFGLPLANTIGRADAPWPVVKVL